MAKNKDRAGGPQHSAPSDNATEGKPTAVHPANEQLPLLDEVQAFLNQRAEFLKKVTAEIAATEKKLVELKQTAAHALWKWQSHYKRGTKTKESQGQKQQRFCAARRSAA
jgi:hypothetical protein